MFVLEPISKKRIWGTNRLHQYSGDPNVEKIGSVYTASGIKEISTKIKNGDFAGQGLYDVVNNNPSLFGLMEGEEYPIIISMTGADENLSIQVHPTDEYARINENETYGKSESWYFLSPPEDGWIYAGSKLYDKNIIEQKMKEGKFNDVVDTLSIQQNDYVFIPSGTLHALTKGALVYEIQQSSDITYRFYDYERKDDRGNKRELHLEKALETLVPSQEPVKSIFNEDEVKRETPYDLVKTNLEYSYKNNRDIAQTITVISGKLVIDDETIPMGSSVLVLPGERVEIKNPAQVMIATPKRYWKDDEE